LAELFSRPLPLSITDKKALVLDNHIALWDVLASCEIEGASDSKIRNPRCNDFSALLGGSNIRCVYTTGQKAYMLYTRFCSDKTGIPAIPLPSTSPANCRVSFAELLECYSKLRADGL
ncbi:MAG: DNA-deoxyinosine glycosylase, partial [Spirochaetaceae bacterium]|nr:DNA-deoxyinosine glycosylase [Spirochaetaceae bacterium]